MSVPAGERTGGRAEDVAPNPLPAAGPRVVALGGGHGQAATLRAARRYARELTAVVSVADDGGSSGRLRRDLGILPPGDLRKCLVALAGEGSILAVAFENRFDGEDGLVGHALGNLVLAGLVSATGNVQKGLDEAGRLLGAVGRVVPAGSEPTVLKAEIEGGEIEGQSEVSRTAHIRRVSLVPCDPGAPELAVDAIKGADQVVMGPGSLFTSVLAAATVPGIRSALEATPARKVYVANLHPQVAETDGFDVAQHVRALKEHGISVDVVVADTAGIALGDLDVPVVVQQLARPNGLAHDPGRLARALCGLVG
ncbi:MAG TPA: uridine diphosphate-N-acetylglucosamine-binding protein YvcK [Acidimicrobiales bacterium]|nr:uridine diphosphate-N-acetylglucosamine-binding protein YvcK [Acidimicrobiales bacterium]